MKPLVAIAAAAMSASFWLPSSYAGTLAAVRAKASLACGVVTEATDWDKEDLHGDLSALDADICRAVATAVLGRPEAASLHEFPAEAAALHGLAAGEVDLVVGVTPGVTQALQYGVAFGPPVFWDTQTFLVHRSASPAYASGLAGRTVCYIDGTDIGGVLLAAMRTRGIAIRPFPFQEEGEMASGLAGGRCGAITAYASRLAGLRALSGTSAGDLVLLDDVLAVLPLAVATRQGDSVWTAIAAATVDTLVQAEMSGITRVNLATRRHSQDPVVSHLLGDDWSAAQALGLAHDWSAQVIGTIGNYGEVFARTAGENSPLGLKRGLNAVCLQGGALCAAPLR